MTRLRLIARTGPREYRVVIEVDGQVQTCVCQALRDGQIRYVRSVPPILDSFEVSPKLIAAAVLAFDEVESSGERSPD